MPKCGVCSGAESKYKCPVCRLPYCSVTCFKKHKETPCSTPDPQPGSGSQASPGQPRRDFEEDDEDDDGVRLRRHHLEKLAFDPSVRASIKDERLQKILLEIDSAEGAEEALDKAMLTPEFKEFADKVLCAIDPERDT
mmetsp:Transcript_30928/g.98746  ORF Transcript_30928/g.98746 Transcript_30928/m.98746 type:complete len:138 (-) Transcript_30928:880-1293(-)